MEGAVRKRRFRFGRTVPRRRVRAVACFHPEAPCNCRFFDAGTGAFLGWGYETGEMVAGPDGRDLPGAHWIRFEVVEFDHPFAD